MVAMRWGWLPWIAMGLFTGGLVGCAPTPKPAEPPGLPPLAGKEPSTAVELAALKTATAFAEHVAKGDWKAAHALLSKAEQSRLTVSGLENLFKQEARILGEPFVPDQGLAVIAEPLPNDPLDAQERYQIPQSVPMDSWRAWVKLAIRSSKSPRDEVTGFALVVDDGGSLRLGPLRFETPIRPAVAR